MWYVVDTYVCEDGTLFDGGKGLISDSDSYDDDYDSEESDVEDETAVCQHCNKSRHEHKCKPGEMLVAV